MRQIVSFILLSCAVLGGCADQPYWHRNRPPATDITIRHVSGSPNPRVIGWAEITGGGTGCIIYLTPRADACVEAHERMHCAGFDHATGAIDESCFHSVYIQPVSTIR
jgi:hypothetical protein